MVLPLRPYPRPPPSRGGLEVGVIFVFRASKKVIFPYWSGLNSLPISGRTTSGGTFFAASLKDCMWYKSRKRDRIRRSRSSKLHNYNRACTNVLMNAAPLSLSFNNSLTQSWRAVTVLFHFDQGMNNIALNALFPSSFPTFVQSFPIFFFHLLLKNSYRVLLQNFYLFADFNIFVCSSNCRIVCLSICRFLCSSNCLIVCLSNCRFLCLSVHLTV